MLNGKEPTNPDDLFINEFKDLGLSDEAEPDEELDEDSLQYEENTEYHDPDTNRYLIYLNGELVPKEECYQQNGRWFRKAQSARPSVLQTIGLTRNQNARSSVEERILRKQRELNATISNQSRIREAKREIIENAFAMISREKIHWVTPLGRTISGVYARNICKTMGNLL
jgi:hypothetical protein